MTAGATNTWSIVRERNPPGAGLVGGVQRGEKAARAARYPEPLAPLGFRASLDVCRGRADRAGAEHLPAGAGAAQRGSRLIPEPPPEPAPYPSRARGTGV